MFEAFILICGLSGLDGIIQDDQGCGLEVATYQFTSKEQCLEWNDEQVAIIKNNIEIFNTANRTDVYVSDYGCEATEVN